MTQDCPSWVFLEYLGLSLSQSSHNTVMSLLWLVFPTMAGIRAGSWVSNTWPRAWPCVEAQ